MISKQQQPQQQNMAILDEEINFAQNKMEELPTNLSLDKTHNCDKRLPEMEEEVGGPLNSPSSVGDKLENPQNNDSKAPSNSDHQVKETTSETRIHLSFSVDRLLNNKTPQVPEKHQQHHRKTENDNCCSDMNNGGGGYSCCTLPNCLVGTGANHPTLSFPGHAHNEEESATMGQTSNLMDFKSIVRPTPMRAEMGNNGTGCGPEQVNPMAQYNATLLRLHQAHIQQKSMAPHPHLPAQPNFTLASLMNPMCSIKTVSANPHPVGLGNFSLSSVTPNSRYTTKGAISFDLPGIRPNMNCISNLRHHSMTSNESHLHFPAGNVNASTGNGGSGGSGQAGNNGSSSSHTPSTSLSSNGKRKRSWSRAVFSNLQRKGLEIQFQQQKYITKPDRRKLAARLNLTDAQVKVWFQNRRMKWRHTRENLKSGHEKQPQQTSADNNPSSNSTKMNMEASSSLTPGGYSSDCSSSLELSDADDDEDEIDVVE
uniref:Homeobox domain-containing protein n=1 Tax=Musca domestica TaxID=7370 RepID=A0A1I8MPF2_MUSDO